MVRATWNTKSTILLAIALAGCSDGAPSKIMAPANSASLAEASEESTPCVGPMTGTFDKVVVPAGGNCKLILSHVLGYVRVQAGGSLEVLGSRIERNVLAEAGHVSLGIGGIASGGGIQGSFVGGDVIAIGTVAVLPPYGVNYLCNTRVEHDVRIVGGSAVATWDIGLIPFPCTFGNSIGGNVGLVRNEARIRLANNTPTTSPSGSLGTGGIGGDVNFISNSSLLDPHVIKNNTVDGSVLAFLNRGGTAITENRIERNLICKENEPPAVAAGNVVGGHEDCTD
jgi:hypothetical protein